MITLFTLFVMIMMGATVFDMVVVTCFFSYVTLKCVYLLFLNHFHFLSFLQERWARREPIDHQYAKYLVSKSNTSSSSSSDSEFIIQCSTIPWLKSHNISGITCIFEHKLTLSNKE
jgi:hypothetical protein